MADEATQRRQKFKRSTQVCTNCRQGKNRCDFRERFPEPCSRCAALGDSRSCYVDPTYKRKNVRNRADAVETGESLGESPIHHEASSSTPQPNTSPDTASSEPKFRPTAADRRQGGVHLTALEIDMCFQEFFQRCHPFFPVMLDPIDPTTAFTESLLLFWTICGIACRPHPNNPVVRARTAELCLSIAHETRLLIAETFLHPGLSVRNIQALLLHCEFPLAGTRFRAAYQSWFYSGFAVQLALSLGLHRPHFANEFVLRAQFTPKDVQQRTLVWAQCFIVHQSNASSLGLPSSLSDDWVTSSASQPTSSPEPLIALDTDVSKLLRIQRFALRVSTVMGNDVRSKSGQDSSMGPALIPILSSELNDIENGLSPMSPQIAVRFLEVKLHLYTYSLQEDMMGRSSVDLLSCYTSSIRMLELLQKLNATFETGAAYWPRTMLLSALLAVLCLLKLTSLQAAHRQKFSVDRNVILREIMNTYAILRTRSMIPNDEADKACTIIHFLSHRLANTAHLDPDEPKRPAMHIRSRMSLGGLLYDAIYEIKQGPWKHVAPGPSDPDQERAGRTDAGVYPLQSQMPGMDAQFPVPVVFRGAPVSRELNPQAMSSDVTDLEAFDDVFGWLNGVDPQAMDYIMQEVASMGPLGTTSWVDDVPSMPM